MASSSTTSAPQRKYHVFLSFRGKDTRDFTKDLFAELKERAINAFMDDYVLERGTNLSEGFKLAIEQSRLSIVIISKNYASSRWCLDELAHICKNGSDNIIPIFYGVDPGDVRHQRGSFAEHFIQHENTLGKGSKEVLEWRDAMEKLGNLAGWKLSTFRSETDRSETELIEDEVWRKIHSTFKTATRATQKSVKIVKKINDIDSLLKLDSNDIRFIGIWGTDERGINATAALVYDRIHDNFELSSFLREIRVKSHNKGLVYLQNQLLTELNGRSVEVPDVSEGNKKIKECVLNRKVLRILDDVNQSDQIDILGGKKDWYGCGSRIIFTSMDRDLLVTHGNIHRSFLLEGLSAVEARQLYN